MLQRIIFFTLMTTITIIFSVKNPITDATGFSIESVLEHSKKIFGDVSEAFHR